MKTEEMTFELVSIRRQITNLGHKHLQSILPVSLGKIEDKMPQDYSYYLRDLKALEMAYNKILNRGGILIGDDYFKPTDPEYIKYMQENENNI